MARAPRPCVLPFPSRTINQPCHASTSHQTHNPQPNNHNHNHNQQDCFSLPYTTGVQKMRVLEQRPSFNTLFPSISSSWAVPYLGVKKPEPREPRLPKVERWGRHITQHLPAPWHSKIGIMDDSQLPTSLGEVEAVCREFYSFLCTWYSVLHSVQTRFITLKTPLPTRIIFLGRKYTDFPSLCYNCINLARQQELLRSRKHLPNFNVHLKDGR